MSNSHSGALLARINRTTSLGGGRSSGAGVSSSSGGNVAAATLVIFLALARVACGLSNGLSVLLVLVHGPVEHVVVLKSFANEEITEDLAEVRVIRLVVEAERTSVVQVDGKFVGESTAKNLGGSRHLLLHDAVVLLLLGGGLESLPGKGSAAEVEHDIAERLHVVTAGLLCYKLAG